LEALDNYLMLSDVKRWQDLPKRVTMTSQRKAVIKNIKIRALEATKMVMEWSGKK